MEIVLRGGQLPAGGEVPVVSEDSLQFARSGSFHDGRDVVPRADSRIFTRILTAEIHPADERHLRIDDLQLAMIPQIEGPAKLEELARAEPGELAPSLDQR